MENPKWGMKQITIVWDKTGKTSRGGQEAPVVFCSNVIVAVLSRLPLLLLLSLGKFTVHSSPARNKFSSQPHHSAQIMSAPGSDSLACVQYKRGKERKGNNKGSDLSMQKLLF